MLITGSRKWRDRPAVYNALDEQLLRSPQGMVVINGCCPEGADALAHVWYLDRRDQGYPVHEESYPADWYRDCDENCYHAPRTKGGRNYCPVAGHLRNQQMVDSGADICLAFPIGTKASKRSRGTWDCMTRAKRAGIDVYNLGVDQELDDRQQMRGWA
ncbi:SLOG family protein [Mycolicibacterium phlei]|uniref:SLOG family protein n=1 Tax=Mycolicibacterium phlei TaxID=1771 RepID=UPI001ED9564F|nr:SLOG family protein [Mycolicibacterium phlei]